MGLFSSREQKNAQCDQDKLARSQQKRGIREETPAYQRANARTNAAAASVPWWRR